ncbi:DUF4062 domain-containing protein [Ponticaulis sp.]|uniref:DUF4062 domain-containing protein n=1 Tax=Ponticaulis sp. TaxID=2020902 RepID=UPI002606C6AA|nr:DUF4062 domain-containing protein [Ponticaulis sp.]MDF1679372.1 DUF4062 domain-containing protein [Ponticaulis sp.]
MKKKLQVFVSSTYTDLHQERQAAVLAILKAGHIPAGMELFTAGDKAQMTVIERWIDESDVYMLILGGRYGSIEETTGLSYTELEYDYAAAAGKRLFAVVIKEDALETKIKTEGSSVMETENPKALKQFREKVLMKMSSFFSNESDVRLAVYESLSDFSADSSLKGWVSAGDAQDVSTLLQDINNLRDENDALRNEVEQLKVNREPTEEMSKPSLDMELVELLRNVDLIIPAHLASGEEEEVRNLFDIAFLNKDALISGASNSGSASDAETFFYFNLLPKLQTHGLASNEKVAGVQWRRSFLNQRGIDLFAAFERKLLENKEREAQSASRPTESSNKKSKQSKAK